MILRSLAFAILILSTIISGCGREQGGEPPSGSSTTALQRPSGPLLPPAESATATLHERYNNGDFGQIYEQAAPGLRSAATAEQVFTQLEGMQSEFGKWQDGTLAASGCHANEIRLMFHSNFEKQPGTEYIVYRVDGGAASLLSFNVAPGHTEIPEQQDWAQCN
ncbi:MAG: hypothetical protein ABR524_05165 [Thermoanaerobaculia bacterium]